jgi:hypothetical protein
MRGWGNALMKMMTKRYITHYTYIHRVFKKELHYAIPNITLW